MVFVRNERVLFRISFDWVGYRTNMAHSVVIVISGISVLAQSICLCSFLFVCMFFLFLLFVFISLAFFGVCF